jgi:hypothetical protein
MNMQEAWWTDDVEGVLALKEIMLWKVEAL